MKKIQLTPNVLKNLVYQQYKQMVLEQTDQEDPAADQQKLAYEKIKQLAELGKKIEQQIQNSMSHLNAFLSLGMKTEDPYEFKRAVAEIGRIQKLTADYQTIIVKAHETAEANGSEVEQPQNEVDKPPKGFSPTTKRVPPKKMMPGHDEYPEDDYDDAELINKGGKRDWFTESNMSELALEISELAKSLKTNDPTAIAKELHKMPKYSKASTLALTRFVADYLKQGLNEYGIVIQNLYTESIYAIDKKAKSPKDAAIRVGREYPGHKILHIVESTNFGERPDVDAFIQSMKKSKADDDSIIAALQDEMGLSKISAETAVEKSSKKEQLVGGDPGSNVAMPPDKHEMQEGKPKATDMNGQEINLRDHVVDQSWNPNTQKWETSKESFKVIDILGSNKIVVLDLQTKKRLAINPKDVIRKGSTHVFEEFDSWTCMECHYKSPKRFSKCPKCGSGEIENLGEERNGTQITYRIPSVQL